MPAPFQGPQAFNLQGFAMGFRSPPFELLLIELVYFLAIAAICLAVYLKTWEIYRLSQHRGVFHFKNIFLYFAISYFFRFAHMFLLVSEEIFSVDLSFFALRLTMFLVSYCGTMAILSLFMAAIAKNIKTSADRHISLVLHGIALVLALFAAVPRSNSILIALQTALLLAALMVVFLKPGRKPKKILSQNRLTYILLAVFWVANLLPFSVRFLPLWLKTLLYLLSIGVFLSIFLRVQKRLPPNAKKKRQA